MAEYDIRTKAARAKLEARTPPYWHRIEAGLFVGFRKLKTGDGTWHARIRDDDGKQKGHALGTLEDLDEAVKLARAWAKGVESGASHKATSVEAACRAYVSHQASHKSKDNANDAEGRFKRLVYGKPIAALSLDKLRTTHIRKWLDSQLDDDGDEEDLRRSKDSANRNLTPFKAALNLALKDRLVATDSGWKTVTPFPGVGRRRDRYVTLEDRSTLLENSPLDLRALLEAMLLTGARPGELAHANVGDFDAVRGTIRLDGKIGLRTVALSTRAAAFFKTQSTSKLPSAPLLARADGKAWNKDGWKDRVKAAVLAAKLPDDIVLYSLRHAAITDLISGGVDVFTVAALTGTSVLMIQKHYGHLQVEHTRARLDAAHQATS